MDLVVFEENRALVLSSLCEGKFDYIDITTQIAETKFFRFLMDKGMIEHLGKTYPNPRQKKDVPSWMAVMGNISLRIHGSHSFYSFPYIVRLGGLIDALSPEIAQRKVDRETKRIEIRCEGFNDKNIYPRKAPCDQDFIRKLSRDTPAEDLLCWYNREIIWCINHTIGFDEEGIFIGDASYLFVPDNERYENSCRLLFDEHNHPVSVNKVELKKGVHRHRWRRCYQKVSLIHINRKKDYFLTVAVAVISGKENPLATMYELIEGFVRQSGVGVMKKIILDRGFIDGERISHLKKDMGTDVVIGVRTDMDVYQEAIILSKDEDVQWVEYHPPEEKMRRDETVKPDTIRKREESREDTLAKKRRKNLEEEPVRVKTLVTQISDIDIWKSCSVPVHAVVSREIYSDGHEDTWVVCSTERVSSPTLIRGDYGLRPTIEERHRQQKCFWDLTSFRSVAFSLVVNQVVMVELTYTLLQIQVFSQFGRELNALTLPRLKEHLEPRADRVVVYYKQFYTFLILHEYSEILLTLKEDSRLKVLGKIRRLKRDILHFAYSPRPP